MKFKIGDSVIVNSEVSDPELNTNIGGWQGRITDIENNNLICIEWDSITLDKIPASTIIKCEQDGLGWDQMSLYESEVSLARARDSHEDVEVIIDKIEKKYEWVYLGEEGERIQKVLSGVLSGDIRECYEAWEIYLNKNLTFPFHAVIAESEEGSILREGDHISVFKLDEIVDMYGILARIKSNKKSYVFPLCDIEVKNNRLPHYQLVKDHSVWFSNKG
jgi:hypothetical protein